MADEIKLLTGRSPFRILDGTSSALTKMFRRIPHSLQLHAGTLSPVQTSSSSYFVLSPGGPTWSVRHP
jgi:hypothetical protein